jgi:hypothetical protein
MILVEHFFSTLNIEAICFSETWVTSQQTTRRHIPEDDNLQSFIQSEQRKRASGGQMQPAPEVKRLQPERMSGDFRFVLEGVSDIPVEVDLNMARSARCGCMFLGVVIMNCIKTKISGKN